MRVLHIHTTTQQGGAAIVARGLMASQRELGLQVSMLAGWGREFPHDFVSSLDQSRWRNAMNAAVFRLNGTEAVFSHAAWWKVLRQPQFQQADVIHLHNAHGYYLPEWALDQILKKPVVWTLHDFWMLTGRCATPEDCVGYNHKCAPCPHLKRYPGSYGAKSARNLERRRAILARDDITFVAPSRYVARRIERDAGLPSQKINVVTNPVSVSSRLQSPNVKALKEAARREMGVPVGHTVFLFISRRLDEPSKGLKTLLQALGGLDSQSKCTVLFVGECNAKTAQLIEETGVDYRVLGTLKRGHELESSFLAADAVVAPVAMETFGLIFAEAVAAGAGVIASDLPVIREILAVENDSAEWRRLFPLGDATALRQILEEFSRSPSLPSEAVRTELIERFTPTDVARRYTDLYHSTLQQFEKRDDD